jgi:hypothetical protein
VLEENYSLRRMLDYLAHKTFNSKQGQNETIGQWGARMDTMCGDFQKAARKHMEDLAWTNEKQEGRGDIIDLIIRACLRLETGVGADWVTGGRRTPKG